LTIECTGVVGNRASDSDQERKQCIEPAGFRSPKFADDQSQYISTPNLICYNLSPHGISWSHAACRAS